MKSITFIFVLCFAMANLSAQDSRNSNISVGLQVNRYQDDFGIGVHAVSPYFLKNRVAVKMRANRMFHDHPSGFNYVWSSYTNFSLGIVGMSGNVTEYIRLYGEGGVLALLPSENISSDRFIAGGYGLFGFEFLVKGVSGYFIEIGGAGIGAKGDRLPGNRSYSNGMVISSGFRFYLK